MLDPQTKRWHKVCQLRIEKCIENHTQRAKTRLVVVETILHVDIKAELSESMLWKRL